MNRRLKWLRGNLIGREARVRGAEGIRGYIRSVDEIDGVIVVSFARSPFDQVHQYEARYLLW